MLSYRTAVVVVVVVVVFLLTATVKQILAITTCLLNANKIVYH